MTEMIQLRLCLFDTNGSRQKHLVLKYLIDFYPNDYTDNYFTITGFEHIYGYLGNSSATGLTDVVTKRSHHYWHRAITELKEWKENYS